MKSIIKVKFIGIDYYTHKKVTFKKVFECDDLNFVDVIIPPMKINKGKFTLPEHTITAEQQADEWVELQSDLLDSIIHDNKRELQCILNWDILSVENISDDNKKELVVSEAKKEKIPEIERIGLILSLVESKQGTKFSEDFRNNFMHTYQEMKDVLVGMSIYKKILITLRSMGVGMKAASTAYQRISEVLRMDIKEIELKDKLLN